MVKTRTIKVKNVNNEEIIILIITAIIIAMKTVIIMIIMIKICNCIKLSNQ